MVMPELKSIAHEVLHNLGSDKKSTGTIQISPKKFTHFKITCYRQNTLKRMILCVLNFLEIPVFPVYLFTLVVMPLGDTCWIQGGPPCTWNIDRMTSVTVSRHMNSWLYNRYHGFKILIYYQREMKTDQISFVCHKHKVRFNSSLVACFATLCHFSAEA